MALKGIGLNGKAEIHMRKLKMWLLGLAAAAMLSVSACAQEIPEESLNGNGSVSAEENQAESADGDSQAVSSSENGGNSYMVKVKVRIRRESSLPQLH